MTIGRFDEQNFIKPKRYTDGVNFDFVDVDNLLARDYVQGNIIVPVRIISQFGESAPETKITVGTDILSINADGSLNVSPSKKTPAWATQVQNGAGTATIGTVPVGKKWTILAIALNVSGIAGGIVDASVNLNGTAILKARMTTVATYPQFLAPVMNFAYADGPVITAGQTATLTMANGFAGAGSIVYVEEDA